MTNVRGLYHHRTFASPAWVEIFIDRISDLKYGFYQKIPFLRERLISEVLYHEIGHHIHAVIHPEHREPEDVAEEWEAKLWWHYYVKKRYWYLLPLLRLGGKLVRSQVYQRFYQRFYQKVIEDIMENRKKGTGPQNKEKSK